MWFANFNTVFLNQFCRKKDTYTRTFTKLSYGSFLNKIFSRLNTFKHDLAYVIEWVFYVLYYDLGFTFHPKIVCLGFSLESLTSNHPYNQQ